jgi:hypothetical protein
MPSSLKSKLIKLFDMDNVPYTLSKHKDWAIETRHGVTVLYIPEVDLSFEFTPSGEVLNVTDGNTGSQ